ncbi:MAG: hypothetical protein LC713_03725, partial [Actinobacteria bacterium]|nr:hypothetical protein [Actinomycetota bacterium]
LLVGVIEAGADVICVRGQHATVRIRSASPTALVRLLGRFDGRSSLAEITRRAPVPTEQVHRVAAALFDAGLLIDARFWWRAFHSASGNPRRAAPTITSGVTSLERWSPAHYARPIPIHPTALALPSPPSGQPPRRRSFARHIALNVDPCASETLALQIAYNSYRRIDGCRRPVASAGGLEPIHLLTIGADAANGLRRILAVDDDAETCYELRRLTSQELIATFVDDDVIITAVRHGAAAVLICVDPRRTVGKYGDRGWRYALLEAGAVSHHIALLGAQLGAHCRPVGGFLDDALTALTPSLIPLLAVIIAVERGPQGGGTCA